MSTPTPALELQGLTKRYGSFTALHQMNLTIQAGEIFALLGPNGAGKTTMIGSVCGLVKKTEGAIRVFGQDLDKDPVGPRYQVGLVPQEINFDPFFTVAESLRIQQGFYGQKRDEARVDEVLTALNLHTKKDSLTRALSGGMKRRLLIAKALVHKPRLVFLDEPTAGVDVELRRDLWTYVRKLASQGTTIVLTTHYLEEAEELADRVGIINEGKLLMVEDKATLLKRFGEKRVVVTFDAPQTTLSEAVRRFTARLAEDGRSLTYVEREGVAPAGDLLRVLYAEGLPIADVETRRSRLEDVLLEVLRGRPSTQAA
ncbi:ABC transporter ATP-binding protein [Myxococcus stipitatus]|uniref:ABC transporter ATP-binding protein n=1 Tax=Myxococcus stipitatus TaxID=83455 RepID=UPI003144E497